MNYKGTLVCVCIYTCTATEQLKDKRALTKVLFEQRQAQFKGWHDTHLYWLLWFTSSKGKLDKSAVRATSQKCCSSNGTINLRASMTHMYTGFWEHTSSSYLFFTNFKGKFDTCISNRTVERQTRPLKSAIRATDDEFKGRHDTHLYWFFFGASLTLGANLTQISATKHMKDKFALEKGADRATGSWIWGQTWHKFLLVFVLY